MRPKEQADSEGPPFIFDTLGVCPVLGDKSVLSFPSVGTEFAKAAEETPGLGGAPATKIGL